MESVSTLVTVGASAAIIQSLGGKDLLVKVLGPSADYLGTETLQLTKRGTENLKRIFENASKKLRDKTNESAGVPVRVKHRIFQEGFFCEDELMAEYLGGVLASSKVSNLRDDRGLSWINTLSRLTSYQIRAHYVFYMAFRDALMSDTEIMTARMTIKGIMGRQKGNSKSLIVLKENFKIALGLDDSEDVESIIDDVSLGLTRENLATFVGTVERHPTELRVDLTSHGMSLLLWGNGFGTLKTEDFFNAELMKVEEVQIPAGRLIPTPRNDVPVWG